jgi:hypothetical protein
MQVKALDVAPAGGLVAMSPHIILHFQRKDSRLARVQERAYVECAEEAPEENAQA